MELDTCYNHVYMIGKIVPVSLLGLLLGSVIFQIASAQTLLVLPTGPQTGGDVIDLILRLTDWLFFGFLLLAVIFIILAAVQFLTGGGDPAQVALARKKLFIAGGAVAIAVLSRGFIAVVRSVIGV